jgi:hypothetical protein
VRFALAALAVASCTACARAVTPADAVAVADASADVVPPADAGPYPQSIFVRACALSRSCGIPFDPLGLPGVYSSDCVAWFQVATSTVGVLDAFTQATFNCAVMAHDCASFRACAIGTANPACPGPSQCMGSIRRECDRAPGGTTYSAVAAFDCASAMPPQMCVESMGTADCSDGTACNSTDPPRCEGDVSVRCNPGGRITRAECQWLFPGTSCTAGVCASGAACAGMTGVVCTGSVATVCDVRTNHVLSVDCRAVFDGTCSMTSSSGIVACVPDATECTFGTWRCNGTRLETCVNGHVRGIDCSSIGLSTCGVGRETGAVCE